LWNLLKQTGSNWLKHKDARLGAALAYYSIFSVGPLILIAIAVAGLWFGEDAVRGQVSAQIEDVVGSSGAQAVQSMLAGAARPRAGLLATAVGIVTLLFAAIGVVVQLKDALNTVWGIESKEGGIWQFVRTYLVSLAGVLLRERVGPQLEMYDQRTRLRDRCGARSARHWGIQPLDMHGRSVARGNPGPCCYRSSLMGRRPFCSGQHREWNLDCS
jgi:Virulence factor BrkB